ncbi:MAG TPA: glycosyltransferase [Xanthobacteraceae bacterium]|nr:glycosyltransferase [Xanthobacteraceae bacterium]
MRIAEGVLRLAPQYGLRCDVAVEENDRLYGEAWISFLSSCKAVLGTEGGSSIWDYDGSAERAVDDYLAANPGASFDEVAHAVLNDHEGNLCYNAISPRVFEAAALRTPMIMFPGWYNGVVEPERHYIVLAKDFSNFSDVVERLRDDAYLQALADRTYTELVASGAYSKRAFAAKIDEAIEAAVLERRSLGEAHASQPSAAASTSPTRGGFWMSAGRLWGRLYYPLTLPVVLLRKLGAVLRDRRSTLGDRWLQVAALARRLPNHVAIYRGSTSLLCRIMTILCLPTAGLIERCVRSARRCCAWAGVMFCRNPAIRDKRAEMRRLLHTDDVKHEPSQK